MWGLVALVLASGSSSDFVPLIALFFGGFVFSFVPPGKPAA